jgi:hypothetical protein
MPGSGSRIGDDSVGVTNESLRGDVGRFGHKVASSFSLPRSRFPRTETLLPRKREIRGATRIPLRLFLSRPCCPGTAGWWTQARTASSSGETGLNQRVGSFLCIAGHHAAFRRGPYALCETRENSPGKKPPDGYENKGNQNMLSAAFVSDWLPAIMRCWFGSSQHPPRDVDA